MFESLKTDFKGAFSTLRHRPGVAAALVPALRASRTDPWSSLRAE